MSTSKVKVRRLRSKQNSEYDEKYQWLGHLASTLLAKGGSIRAGLTWLQGMHATMEEGEEKDYLIKAIANHLKKSYLAWNRDSVNDKTIFKHLEKLSNGKLKLNEDQQLLSTNEILSRSRITKHKSNNYRKDNGGKRRNYNPKRY